MRHTLLAFLVLVAGCVRGNPDYVAGDADAGTTPISGPGVDGGPTIALDAAVISPADLMSMDPAKDLSQPGLPDLKMSDPGPGPGPGAEGVVCGSDLCDAPQFCCSTFGQRECVSPGLAVCAAGKDYRCDGPEDCGDGKFCCNTLDGSACKDSCNSFGRFCHKDTDCGNNAPHCCPNPTEDYKTCSSQDC